jgi:hypothetical protein
MAASLLRNECPRFGEIDRGRSSEPETNLGMLICFTRVLSLSVFFALTACDDATAVRLAGPPAAIEIVSGNGQAGPANEELPEQLVARVTDEDGRSVEEGFVYWEGDGLPFADATEISSEGITRNYWTLGPTPGGQRIELWSFDPVTGERGERLGSFTATAR